jgi:tRNA 2-thiouridine synthesizing protein A
MGLEVEEIKVNKTLDCTGLNCPMPAVKTALELEKLRAGEVLEVITTDPVSQVDLPKWCQETGHHLLEIKKEAGVFYIYIQKKA